MIGRSANPKIEALLRAGVRLFAERGYHPVNVEDVLAAAGVSRATFYAHFASKEDLFTAIVDELLREQSAYLLDLQQEFLAAGTDLAGTIDRVLTTIAEQASANRDALRLFFDVVLRSETRAAERFRAMQRVMLDHFDGALRRRTEGLGYSPAAARALAVLVIGGLSHVARGVVDGDLGPTEIIEIGRGVRDLFTEVERAPRPRAGKGGTRA
jgi:AcrR family transcriptional regulator